MSQRIVGAVSLLLLLSHSLSVVASEQPNIVVILADDLGYGDVSCNNPDSKIATPNIDRIAREGIRFTDAHSPASWCTPTRYGLLTGRYPFRTNLNWSRPVIEADRLTLPGMLRQHGYQTTMVGKWHLGFDFEDRSQEHRGGPIDRGFQRYFGIPASLDIPPYYYLEGNRPIAAPSNSIGARNTVGWSPIQGEFWREGGIAPDFRHMDVLPRFTERAEFEIQRFSRRDSDDSLFLYVALPAPHTPWLPTAEFAGKSQVPLYGDFVMQVDATVGRILAAIDKAGIGDDTLVIFSSDNGPVWYDEDEVKYQHRSTSHFRGMKGDAWEGGHRLPLLMRWPNKISQGRVTNHLVCLTDLMATCASLVQHELPKDAGEDSFDISTVLLDTPGQSVSQRETLIVNSTAEFVMIRKGEWKLIPFRGSGGFSKPKHIQDIPPGEPRGQLYDLSTDPEEAHNLYDQHPEIVADLTTLLEQTKRNGRSR